MKRFADKLWEYFKPKIEELTRSNVWYFRAQVTKPALDGKITVQRPFDGEIALPYVSSMENAAIGAQVTVFVFGSSMTNAVICGNGSLSILGGSPSSGGGGGSAENAVLYVTQMLSAAQQSQARNNIGAISADELSGKQDAIEAVGLLKGDGNGGVTAAVPGTDYLQSAPVTSVDGKTGAVVLSGSYATPTQLAEKQQKIMVDGILEGDGTGNIQAAGTLEGALVDYSGSGTTDYDGLQNRPQVNGVTLEGNKTSAELGLYGNGNPPPYPVTAVNGETGKVMLYDLKYTAQSLTNAQKQQARLNIDVPATDEVLLLEDTVTGNYINIQKAMTAGSLLKVTAVDADGNPTALAAAIPGSDYMPAVPVTVSDNGKTLKVVNGVWAASN
nr:MAG TPA: hypothetical protein [Bacteriophage sp.]